MKIYVLGSGRVGRETAKDLLDREVSPEVSRVTLGDQNFEVARSYVRSIRDDRVKAERIDVREPEALASKIEGCDSVINTTWHNFNLQAMEASLKAKVHYTDLGGMYHTTLNQLKLHENFLKSGVTALLCCGSSPGTTNILAAYGASMLDRVEEIKIRFSSKPLGKGEFLFPFSAHSFIDLCTMKPAVFKNGKTIFVEPFSEPEKIVFPEPVGKLEDAYNVLHSAVLTLPISFKDKGTKNVSFKESLGEALTEPIKVMISIGLTSKVPIEVKGVRVAPIDVLYHCVDNLRPPTEPFVWGESVTVVGEDRGNKVEVVLQALHTPDMLSPGYHERTGVAASVIGQMLAGGDIKTRGVLAPEVAVDPRRYLEELAKRNINYDLVVKRLAE